MASLALILPDEIRLVSCSPVEVVMKARSMPDVSKEKEESFRPAGSQDNLSSMSLDSENGHNGTVPSISEIPTLFLNLSSNTTSPASTSSSAELVAKRAPSSGAYSTMDEDYDPTFTLGPRSAAKEFPSRSSSPIMEEDNVHTFTMAPNRAGTGLPVWSKGARASARATHEPQPHVMLNPAIKAYCKWNPELDDDSPEWLSTPEVPTPREIAGLLDGIQVQSDIALKPNANEDPFEDKEDYLETFYCLLREDLVEPLRDAVFEVRRKPDLMEDQSETSAHIYEGVYIKGYTASLKGLAARIEFSIRRAKKQIRWEQSKRLIAGTMVALTPAHDMFQTVCRVCVVAARPLVNLSMSPPSLDIFFSSHDDLEVDPQMEWVMVEATGGYLEAYRHTLEAIKRMAFEKTPFLDNIVTLKKDVSAPRYRSSNPIMDLNMAMNDSTLFDKVDVLKEWPVLSKGSQIEHDSPLRGSGDCTRSARDDLLELQFPTATSQLDDSQFEALHRILTKEIAIIQGPPGTGKTYVSVLALKVLYANMKRDDPPLIVTAHTNHALDQLLRHIAEFEPNFVRLGGQSTDVEIIKPRTLFEIKERNEFARRKLPGCATPGRALRNMRTNHVKEILAPLSTAEPLSPELLLSWRLITEDQYQSMTRLAGEFVGPGGSESASATALWCDDRLVPAKKQRACYIFPEDVIEDIDDKFEQLRDMEAEMGLIEDDEFETLRGTWLPLEEKLTGATDGAKLSDAKIEQLLCDSTDLNKIPRQYRGAVYKYWQTKVKQRILNELRASGKLYANMATDSKIGRWEVDYTYLKTHRIIGMTTTGLSKNRAMLAALNPKVVLIEEAAETLEPYVTAALFPSLEHLILVGDHQQLRGHTSAQKMAGDPFWLDVSMFERLVQGKIEFTQLNRQRRMRPDIRELINPIYPSLQDHPSVRDRENVPGMGGINVWFHNHTEDESFDDATSIQNSGEAAMIVGLFNHLVLNGVEVEDVTVVTFYNGQRKLIVKMLKSHPNLMGNRFNVVTVDSYQGEENKIIILSLVRNNDRNAAGFTNVENRVCVALSRAKMGFYIFGNKQLIGKNSNLWLKVIEVLERGRAHMDGKNYRVSRLNMPDKFAPSRLGWTLPITCEKHHKRVDLMAPSDWANLVGGCRQECGATLLCGHKCPLLCHPIPHSLMNCQEYCGRLLSCGHACAEKCFVEPCPRCRQCNTGYYRDFEDQDHHITNTKNNHHEIDNIAAYNDFARGGVVAHDARLRQEKSESVEEQLRQQADRLARLGLDATTPGGVAESNAIFWEDIDPKKEIEADFDAKQESGEFSRFPSKRYKAKEIFTPTVGATPTSLVKVGDSPKSKAVQSILKSPTVGAGPTVSDIMRSSGRVATNFTEELRIDEGRKKQKEPANLTNALQYPPDPRNVSGTGVVPEAKPTVVSYATAAAQSLAPKPVQDRNSYANVAASTSSKKGATTNFTKAPTPKETPALKAIMDEQKAAAAPTSSVKKVPAMATPPALKTIIEAQKAAATLRFNVNKADVPKEAPGLKAIVEEQKADNMAQQTALGHKSAWPLWTPPDPKVPAPVQRTSQGLWAPSVGKTILVHQTNFAREDAPKPTAKLNEHGKVAENLASAKKENINYSQLATPKKYEGGAKDVISPKVEKSTTSKPAISKKEKSTPKKPVVFKKDKDGSEDLIDFGDDDNVEEENSAGGFVGEDPRGLAM